MSYEIDAISVGHDLARGTTAFQKMLVETPVTSVEVDEDGLPADASAAIFEGAEVLELTLVS